MSYDRYSGTCTRCRREIVAQLELEDHDGILPPPVLGVSCGCTRPPTNVVLTYRGGASAPEHP